MSKKIVILSLCFVSLFGFVSCDRAKTMLSDVLDGEVPSERREGLEYVYKASASDVQVWLKEPNVLVVLDFYSDGCPPCTAMKPLLDRMAEKYSATTAILKLNVGRPGAEADLALQEYDVSVTPTLKFFLNGSEVHELVGGQSEDVLGAAFEKYSSKVQQDLKLAEGDLPGMGATRSAEDMMVRGHKGALPKGFSRVKVPVGANDVTKKMPKALPGVSSEKAKEGEAAKKDGKHGH